MAKTAKKTLFKEEKSISKDIAKLTDDIKKCIIDDLQNVKEQFSTAYKRQFKTNTFKLSFQDKFPFLKDIKLTYVIYLLKNEADVKQMNEMGVMLNSAYDNLTNELEIISYFIKGNPSLDFSESIMHELTHMYQYNKGMDKRRDLYDIVIDMALDTRNEFRRDVGLALYYTFPHEQDAFVHQFYTHSEDGEIDTFRPYNILSTLIYKIKRNYKTNKFTQRAIHELGYSYKSYLKRLHFGLKRFEKKLYNVKRYWLQEAVKAATKRRPIEYYINESIDRTIENTGYGFLAPFSSEDCYDKFLAPQEPSKLFNIINNFKKDI